VAVVVELKVDLRGVLVELVAVVMVLLVQALLEPQTQAEVLVGLVLEMVILVVLE
jgi:hypothetical protein